VTTFADLEAACEGVAHTTHVYFSVCGTGVPFNVGYPFDLGAALDDGVWSHQPIGYPAVAFPMQPSIDAGVAEFVRQLGLWGCDQRKWGFGGYSQGGIVTSNILDRVRTGDLQKYLPTFLGGVTWGNPRREAGHTCPGGIDPGGHGIVTPNVVNTPATVWDFACGKTMVNSPGQDLYATCGYDGSTYSVADEEAIWEIVDEGSLTSFGGLISQVPKLLKAPLAGGTGAVFAILDALNFFVVTGITPHTSYQVVQPIAGDTRDAWAIALDHISAIGAAAVATSAA
jgi:hypothetical protein